MCKCDKECKHQEKAYVVVLLPRDPAAKDVGSYLNGSTALSCRGEALVRKAVESYIRPDEHYGRHTGVKPERIVILDATTGERVKFDFEIREAVFSTKNVLIG